MLAGGPIHADLQAHRTIARSAEQPPTSAPGSLLEWTNLSNMRRAGRETLASPGDPVAQLSLAVLELDCCLLERAVTLAMVNETDGLDDLRLSGCGGKGASSR